MTGRKETKYIAVHCSATPPSMDIGEDELRRWHKDRGWSDIGYNIVIRRDGRIEVGRPLDHRGAHVKGFNSVALGICLIGGVDEANRPEENFNPEQYSSLELTIQFLDRVYPGCEIRGHRDFPGVAKACPSFDVIEYCRKVGLRE